MTLRSGLPALVSLLFGCGGATSDPCDGKSGICVSLRVEGTVPSLDQLQVTVNMPRSKTLNTPTPAKEFKLPVQVPLSLPAGTMSPVLIMVDGIFKGHAVAHGEQMATLVANKGKIVVKLITGSATCDPACVAGQYCDMTKNPPACSSGCRDDNDCLGGTTTKCCDHRCVNLTSDVDHCGACGTACAFANAMASCASSACKIVGCNAGFGDCNATLSDGCEHDVSSDPLNCGACDRPCPASGSNFNVSCTSGTCSGECAPGFDNCNMDPSDGCEEAVTSVTSCGACGNVCAPANVTAPACTALGMCSYEACLAGFIDVDGNRANGCEVNTATDPRHCGAQDRACSMSNVDMVRCEGGVCTSTCLGNFGNCLMPSASPSPSPSPDDGCETNIATDPSHCGRCDRPCTTTQVVSRLCAGGLCTSTCNGGFGNCTRPAAGTATLPVVDNGCETTLGTNSNCATCGNMCMGIQTCQSNVCSNPGCFSTGNVLMNPTNPAQYTRCSAVSNNNHTCANPTITYGSVTTGVPCNHPANDYTKWCQQLGCAGYVANSVVFGTRSYASPAGKLFWCTLYDDTTNPHWCDWSDGLWYNQSLGANNGSGYPDDTSAITSITCN